MKIDNFNHSVIADNGVVATSQPLAAEVGLKILKHGGNAVDAALATAVALTVVEPTSNGIGGDVFAIVWDGQKLQGLNASGKSPALLRPDMVRESGHQTMPEEGWLPVTVPGAPAAWRDLHARYGSMPLETLFEPAIEFAQNGFEVTPVVAFNWKKSQQRFSAINDPACEYWSKTFTSKGASPRSGDMYTFADHAQTLETMLSEGINSFYSGELAKRIIEFSRSTGGYLSLEDLQNHSNTWVDPVSVNYKGVDVVELPPNGQGLAALLALAMLQEKKIESGLLTDKTLHTQIEAMKLACADVYQYVTDFDLCANLVESLLDEQYIASRAAQIGEQASIPSYGVPAKGGTVYLCTADSSGMMVSYIQSNYEGFGSGVVIPGTGIAMQNRGASFSLDPQHPNVLAPMKRPFHTIIPGFLMQQGKPLGPFGVMGGFMQPQGHLQVASAMIDYGLDPQSALDMPRWRIKDNKKVELEKGLDQSVMEALMARGHEMTMPEDVTGFGRGQIIIRMDDKYIAGSDLRADGKALGY